MLNMICLAIAPLLARSQYSCSDFGDESACTFNTSGTCEWIVDTTTAGVCTATTLIPTMAPTHACPEYFWTGGTEQKICRDHDRCSCYVGGKDCCLSEPQFEDGLYDEDRKHHEKDSCKLEVQFAEYSNSDKAWEGSSPGYLLTTQKHYFAIDIMPEDYECDMDIYWRFEWDHTDCNFDPDDDRRRLRSRRLLCDANTNSLAQVGLAIVDDNGNDVQGGWLHPTKAGDEPALTVEFTVTQPECDDDDCFDNVALYGRMVIVNATSRCRADCYDGRIYPMEIPVWYPSGTYWESGDHRPQVQEKKGLPPWVWWIVSALVVFFWILALLLYTYWWKARDACASLEDTHNEFDEALYDEEVERTDGVQGNPDGFKGIEA